MTDFIVFFEEKEGTTALMRLLDNFNQLSLIHQTGNTGWEPFDRHACGRMSLSSLSQCFEIIFGNDPVDMERLNRIYTNTATGPLEFFDKQKAVGFKMRFVAPKRDLPVLGKLRIWRKYLRRKYRKYAS